MTPEEMQARSREKVKQVMDLAAILHLTCDARERVNLQTGFLEKVVFWTDNEKYTPAEPEASAGEAEAPAEAPKEEVAPGVQEVPAPAEAPSEAEHAGETP